MSGECDKCSDHTLECSCHLSPKHEYNIIEERHIHTSDMKLKFCGYGEWLEELDCIHFEHKGYEAKVLRVFLREPYSQEEHYFGGHLCGYVKIPNNHPYYAKEDYEIDVDVHGGLTFSECDPGFSHWIGFDCAHAGDYIPTTQHMEKTNPKLIGLREMFPTIEGFKCFSIFNPVYRNVEYCVGQCIEMIDQLIAVKSSSKT